MHRFFSSDGIDIDEPCVRTFWFLRVLLLLLLLPGARIFGSSCQPTSTSAPHPLTPHLQWGAPRALSNRLVRNGASGGGRDPNRSSERFEPLVTSLENLPAPFGYTVQPRYALLHSTLNPVTRLLFPTSHRRLFLLVLIVNRPQPFSPSSSIIVAILLAILLAFQLNGFLARFSSFHRSSERLYVDQVEYFVNASNAEFKD